MTYQTIPSTSIKKWAHCESHPIAGLLLASSNKLDWFLDFFLGSHFVHQWLEIHDAKYNCPNFALSWEAFEFPSTREGARANKAITSGIQCHQYCGLPSTSSFSRHSQAFSESYALQYTILYYLCLSKFLIIE